MDLNPLKQRKTTSYFKKLFLKAPVNFYDNPITKKNYFGKFCVSWRKQFNSLRAKGLSHHTNATEPEAREKIVFFPVLLKQIKELYF